MMNCKFYSSSRAIQSSIVGGVEAKKKKECLCSEHVIENQQITNHYLQLYINEQIV